MGWLRKACGLGALLQPIEDAEVDIEIRCRVSQVADGMTDSPVFKAGTPPLQQRVVGRLPDSSSIGF